MLITLLGLGLAIGAAQAQDDTNETDGADSAASADSADGGFEFSTTGRWKDTEIANPRLMLDNSAYTIGRNEVLISPLRVGWGVVENVEVGTNLIFDVFEIYNVRGKVTAIQMERFDASFEATYFQPEIAPILKVDEVDASVLALDWRASWRATPRLGLHGGQSWYLAEVKGDDFSLGDFGKALAKLFGEDLSDEIAGEIDDRTTGTTLYGGVNLNVRRNVIAVDYIVNRRDQIVLVWSALTKARGKATAGTDFNNSQDVNSAEFGDFGLVAGFDIPTSDVLSNSLTIAWQFNWELFHLRLGVAPTIGSVDQNTAIYNTLTEGVQAYWIF